VEFELEFGKSVVVFGTVSVGTAVVEAGTADVSEVTVPSPVEDAPVAVEFAASVVAGNWEVSVEFPAIPPKHDTTSSATSSPLATIADKAHACSFSQLPPKAGESAITHLIESGVLAVRAVVPVPEQAVIVEHSVVKLFVAVPETTTVPEHRGMAVGVHDSVITVSVA
jgi:hypothetical protein